MHATTHQLMTIIKHILQSFKASRKTGTVLLDIAKAFDKVCINGLLYKMAKMEIPLAYIILIKTYLTERSFTVKICLKK